MVDIKIINIIATNFNSILEDIKGNEINCIYIPEKNQNEINLIHDYMLIILNIGKKKKKYI